MSDLQDTDGQQIEEILTPLIKKHGLATVMDHLRAINDRRVKWQDWQRIVNRAKNIDNRLKRKQ